MGPTASGKTRLAIQLAGALGGEIISVDSALVYRGMDIGTAKPDLAERAGVPHHLIDILDPSERYSAGQFLRDALAKMDEIVARDRIPILAGGTMLYFSGLLQGLSMLPTANLAVRETIDAEAAIRGWPALHAQLAQVDPDSARRIHPNDAQRIQRALEVHRLTGRPLSEHFGTPPAADTPYRFCRLVLAPTDRTALQQRIRIRFLAMIEQGLIGEVERLHRRGDLDPDMPALRAVGYRQVWAYLEGKFGHEAMIERAIIATRQFAKRQMTWLKRETGALHLSSGDTDLLAKTLEAIEHLRDKQR